MKATIHGSASKKDCRCKTVTYNLLIIYGTLWIFYIFTENKHTTYNFVNVACNIVVATAATGKRLGYSNPIRNRQNTYIRYCTIYLESRTDGIADVWQCSCTLLHTQN